MAKKKSKDKKGGVVRRWDDYFGEDTLANWQRLVVDLGIDGFFPSKTQCRKALKSVWVNIHDFLDAVAAGTPVDRFRSQRALAQYTQSTNRIYPRKKVVSGSPLSALLANVL